MRNEVNKWQQVHFFIITYKTTQCVGFLTRTCKTKHNTGGSFLLRDRKEVRIIYSRILFSPFGLNTERYEYLSILSPITGKYGPEKLRIRTLFTECLKHQMASGF